MSRGEATREKIVSAAAQVMETHGLAKATTKEIARAAGYSEATLYKHFRDKEELFLNVLTERLPPFIEAMLDLGPSDRPVRDQLTEVARLAIDFYARGVPIAASLFSEPGLLARHRQRLAAQNAGPRNAIHLLARYLRAEQGAGRIASINPDAAAALLLGACFQHAFLAVFLDEPVDANAAHDLVDTLLAGLSSP